MSSRAFNTYVAYRFLRLLTTPFDETDAFKQGIIDREGNPLMSSNDLRTEDQRRAYTIFHRLVFNIKRLLAKFPLGQSRVANFAAALYLIREGANDDTQIEKEFWNFLKESYPEHTKPEVLCEQLNNEEVLEPGEYMLINDMMDHHGVQIPSGSRFRVRRRQKADDHVLGIPVFEVEVSVFGRRKIAVAHEDIQRIAKG